MPTPCQKGPTDLTCTKNRVSPEKSTEAELWLNMMSSMLNFAMASTTLMKSIQNRVEVTKKIEEEARAMRAEEFFRQELAKSKAEFKGDSDFSLRSEPIREDTCGQHTCTLLFRKDDTDECGMTCDGKKSPGSKKLSHSRKKKKSVDSVGTIGDSCVCLVTLPEEPEMKKEVKDEEDDEEEDEDDEAESNMDGICICEPKDCEEVGEDKEVVGDDMPEVKDNVVDEPEVICPATNSFDEKSEDCSCHSIHDREDIEATRDPLVPVPRAAAVPAEQEPVPAAAPPEDVHPIQDCGCQTISSEEIMAKELQLANLAYQLKQTDKNLKELKREMDRISNFVGGKKKCPYGTAAALYEEIMKPRTSVEGTSPMIPRKRR